MNLENLFSLKGKTALVTGGSRGLGKVIAQGFLAAGARVIISSRKSDVCDATARDLGDNCISMPADLSNIAECERLAKAISQKFDKLDILVNNAGAAWGAPIDDFPETGWDKVMDVNLKGPFFLIQKLLPLLRAAGTKECPSKIINIASVDGIRLNGWETYSYHASKAGLIHLTKRLAARLAAEHINVNAIAPGAFASDMNRAARDYGDKIGKAIPAGRIGRPEDIISCAIYLAAQSGNYLVGETICVDGGLVNAALGISIDSE